VGSNPTDPTIFMILSNMIMVLVTLSIDFEFVT
jgi:hypothetical protein